MKYMLLIYSNESEMPKYTPDEQKAAAQAWYSMMQEAQAAGVWMSNNGLSSVADATTLRIREGKTLITSAVDDEAFAFIEARLGTSEPAFGPLLEALLALRPVRSSTSSRSTSSSSSSRTASAMPSRRSRFRSTF